MYLIKANIQLIDALRQRPLQGETCRPLLFFADNIIRSGLIFIQKEELLSMTEYYENRLIGIYFYKDIDYKNIFSVGAKFEIAEGTAVIGYGEIVEVVGVLDA